MEPDCRRERRPRRDCRPSAATSCRRFATDPYRLLLSSGVSTGVIVSRDVLPRPEREPVVPSVAPLAPVLPVDPVVPVVALGVVTPPVVSPALEPVEPRPCE